MAGVYKLPFKAILPKALAICMSDGALGYSVECVSFDCERSAYFRINTHKTIERES